MESNSEIQTHPLKDIGKAATGDWLIWNLEKADFENVVPNNRAHCLQANSVRRVLKVDTVRIEYGTASFKYKGMNYQLQLDEATTDVAVRLDRLSEDGQNWNSEIKPQQNRARLLRVAEPRKMSQSQKDQMKETRKPQVRRPKVHSNRFRPGTERAA